MAIEQIVRPFQTGNVSPPQVVIAAGATESNAPIRVRIGQVAKGKMFTGSISISTTYYVKRKPKEETQ